MPTSIEAAREAIRYALRLIDHLAEHMPADEYHAAATDELERWSGRPISPEARRATMRALAAAATRRIADRTGSTVAAELAG